MLTITAGHAANDVYTSLLPPLLPLFIANLGLSHTAAGLLSLMGQLPSLLQPAIGHLADRFSLRRLLILAPLVTGAMTSLLGLAPNYTSLALLLVAGGASTAAFHAVAPALAGQLSGQRNMGRGMGLWILGGELGFMFGPLLVVSVVQQFGLQATPWLMVIGLAGSLLLHLRLREIPHAVSPSSQLLSWRQALVRMRHVLIPLLGLAAVRSLAMSALSSYLPTYLNEAGTSFWLAGVSLTIYQTAAAAGVLVGGSLSDRLGRRIVMAGSMVVTPLFLLIFLRLGGAARFATLLAVGFAAMAYDPVSMAIVQENAAQNRALVSSVYLSLAFLLRSVAVVLVGAIGDWLGLRWAFAIGAGIFLLGTPLIWALPADGGRPKPEVEAL
jgi:FSR family fosmidomycin resistance protein-like MFS transporter